MGGTESDKNKVMIFMSLAIKPLEAIAVTNDEALKFAEVASDFVGK
jgi:hypothetical protein